MSKKKCDHITHMENCKECRDKYLVNSWMKDLSEADKKGKSEGIPSFDKIWEKSFESVEVSNELIEKAMLPLKIGRIVAVMISLSAILIFVLLKGDEIRSIGTRLFKIKLFDSSIIQPLITMYNSSYFVSIPLTIIFISFLLYFLSVFIKPIGRKNLGSV